MKTKFAVLITFGFLLSMVEISAHPGSAIFVDRQGNVYFVDTGSGVWKIDRTGKLIRQRAPAYHWMAFDPERRLANVRLPNFNRGGAVVERDAADPSILVSSDFSITVGRDGSLYYPWLEGRGPLKIFRLDPSGMTTVHKVLPPEGSSGKLEWLNGLVATADGSLYYTEHRAVRRIGPHGDLTTVADQLTLFGCDSVPGLDDDVGPYLRGLDVDAEGNTYVAATGCRAVLKISTDKKITTLFRSPASWSPTAVAVSGRDLYVLEYLHTPGDNRREWLPRVRKISSDGTVVTVAFIER
jgi:hypothetical protein